MTPWRRHDEVRGVVDASEVRVKIMDSVQSAVKPTPAPSAPVAAAPSAPPVERMQSVKYFTAKDVSDTTRRTTVGSSSRVKCTTSTRISEGAHPGGNASITMNAGEDVTEDFEAVHSSKAWKQLEAYYVGFQLGSAADAGRARRRRVERIPPRTSSKKMTRRSASS